MSDALDAFSARLAEVRSTTSPAPTEADAVALAYERFPWLKPFVQALDALVKKDNADNTVFIVGPSYDVNDLKVSGRIFLQAKAYGEEVIHFVVQGSRMQLNGGTLQSRFFGPDEGDAATRLIAEAAADFFGKSTAGH
jgi:hypothetical protein